MASQLLSRIGVAGNLIHLVCAVALTLIFYVLLRPVSRDLAYYASALSHGEECMKTALAPFDRQIGQHVIGMSQTLLGRVAEGTETIERHRREATAQGWYFTALVTEAPLGVAMLLRGDLKKGARFLESVISRCESEYGYQATTVRTLSELPFARR
jgi:hypothetical protein